ncbi:MAG: hypothetical protein KF841_14200 [Phycisphaerae bacterium]|nr:hypothetical protein [Phycisphaerae bacterium]
MKPETVTIVVSRIALDAEPPERILVCPWGGVKSTSGDFVCDSEAADAILEAFKAHGVDLVVDYEHQTLAGDYSSPSGQAPAAAWIKALEIEEGKGIWANVEWTKKGAEAVRLKEYRYLSPVTMLRKSDRRVVGLHSVSLTNIPAIVGMDPIANSRRHFMRTAHSEDLFTTVRWWLNLPTAATEGDIMSELEKLLAKLREVAGVKEDATAEATFTALKAKLDAKVGISAVICKAAGVADSASEADVVAAINKKGESKSDGTDWKARADLLTGQLEQVNAKVKTLQESSTNRDVETRINKAKADGKITDADLDDETRGPELKRMAADEKLWDTFVGVLPAKVPAPGRVVPNSAKPATGGDRLLTINKAKAEFDAEPGLADLTTREAYVVDALRTAKLSTKLSDEEKKLVA